MRGRSCPLLVPFLALLLLFPAPAAGQQAGGAAAGGEILLVRITDVIGWQQVALVKHALRRVEGGGAGMLILEINTPGGRLDMTRKLVTMLQNLRSSEVETVAFVDGQAYSAGAIIALATGRVYMRENSGIGDAYPIQVDPTGQARKLEDELLEKQLSVMRKEVEILARAFGEGRRERIALLAKAMIDPRLRVRQVQVKDEKGVTETRLMDAAQEDVARSRGLQVTPLKSVVARGELLTLGEREALEYGLADGIVADRAALLDLFGLGPEQLVLIELTAKERFIDFLESISFFLLLGGLLFGFIALKVPGFGVPEVIALTCFFLLFLGHYFTGLADWVEPLLFVGGVALILVEILVLPGTIITGVLGGVMVLSGLILSFQGFLIPETALEEQFLLENMRYFVGTVLFMIVAVVLLSRFLPRIPLFGSVVLDSPGGSGVHASAACGADLAGEEARFRPGQRGRTISALRPVGRALLEGEPVDVQSEGGFLAEGVPVEVVRVDSNRLVVKEVEERGEET